MKNYDDSVFIIESFDLKFKFVSEVAISFFLLSSKEIYRHTVKMNPHGNAHSIYKGVDKCPR